MTVSILCIIVAGSSGFQLSVLAKKKLTNSSTIRDTSLSAKPKKKRAKASKTKGGRGFSSRGFGTKEKVAKEDINVDKNYDFLSEIRESSSQSIIGQATSSSSDQFWQLIPSLIHSRFPSTPESDMKRVAGVLWHSVNPNAALEESIIEDPYRPHEEIHAYMPGLPPTRPFHDSSQVLLCKLLSDNFDTVRQEYEVLKEAVSNRFQSVTSMNYESGWKTLVLFYNGHRIDGFPYHLCPITTKIMESVPLAGRIAGFNRQSPGTGIPKHSDGNNMWLTCQMGIHVPKDQQAHIRVGPETRHWEQGQCLLYDTTYEHETMNNSQDEERVVLHIDFFNTLAMTPIEIEIMIYIYDMREKFLKAEGSAKVGSQKL